MADVYLAEDQELGRGGAQAVIERHADDEQFVERFRREAQSAAGLNHPNIVSIFDRGQAEGTYYIAMEYLDGRTLKELLIHNGPTPIPIAIDYARQILAALAFAHRNGIVHRDIKPHNVIVGGDGRLKVTDFGIARSGAPQMTEAGSIVGTAQYLSPEQARGRRSTRAPTSTRLGSCSTRCSPARCRSRATRRSRSPCSTVSDRGAAVGAAARGAARPRRVVVARSRRTRPALRLRRRVRRRSRSRARGVVRPPPRRCRRVLSRPHRTEVVVRPSRPHRPAAEAAASARRRPARYDASPRERSRWPWLLLLGLIHRGRRPGGVPLRRRARHSCHATSPVGRAGREARPDEGPTRGRRPSWRASTPQGESRRDHGPANGLVETVPAGPGRCAQGSRHDHGLARAEAHADLVGKTLGRRSACSVPLGLSEAPGQVTIAKRPGARTAILCRGRRCRSGRP